MNKTKNLILLILICISVISCKEQEKRVINKGEKYIAPEYPKAFTYHEDDVKDYQSAIVMGSDGHEYMLFNKSASNERLDHYWNCKICKK